MCGIVLKEEITHIVSKTYDICVDIMTDIKL